MVFGVVRCMMVSIPQKIQNRHSAVKVTAVLSVRLLSVYECRQRASSALVQCKKTQQTLMKSDAEAAKRLPNQSVIASLGAQTMSLRGPAD
jgi:hypothetical protein